MLKKLRAKRDQLVAQMRQMNEAAVADPESFKEDEYNAKKTELDRVNASIRRLEELEEYQDSNADRDDDDRQNADDEDSPAQRAMNRNRQSIQNRERSRQNGEGVQNGLGRDDQANLENFSYIGFIRDCLDGQRAGGRIDGLTNELIKEAELQAKNSGVALEGFGIPQSVLTFRPNASGLTRPQNDMTVGTATAGGNLVPTELRSVIDILREKLQVRSLGAQLLGGLQGDIEFPKMAAGSDPDEKAENAVADEYTPSVTKFAMSPKRLPIFAEVSKKLIVQSSTDVEAWLRNELAFRLATRMDQRAINGSGVDPIPEGILQTAGIGSVALGTDGGALTRDAIVDLETAIAVDNADIGTMAFLTTPGVRGHAKKIKLDAGSGLFLWQQGAQDLEGYRTAVSTNVPSNLTKGIGTNLHAMIFGVWSQLMIGQWGGLDIVINPYSRDTEGLIRITLATFYDLGVRHPESFAAIVDIDIS